MTRITIGTVSRDTLDRWNADIKASEAREREERPRVPRWVWDRCPLDDAKAERFVVGGPRRKRHRRR